VVAERLLSIVPAAMLLLAPAPWPYVYYVLLRWVVLVCVGAIAYESFRRRGWHWWTGALTAFVVIFNPILPFHLSHQVWSVLNLAGAALLIAHLCIERGWRLQK
jgi:xanthine/uracil/vitamin C permease (AzgA family)